MKKSEDLLYCRPLEKEIENAYAAPPLDTLANVSRAVVRRTNKCLEVKSHHFEHFLQL